MKIKQTLSLLMIAAITIISFSSCTVQYRAHHPRRYHHYNYVPAVNHNLQTVSIVPVVSPEVSGTR
ncbi:MAG TPA: hypothetical protein VEV62_18865 [Parafilimonas sp.]|nr:hypothetical protein [Parafilimonas sp.]